MRGAAGEALGHAQEAAGGIDDGKEDDLAGFDAAGVLELAEEHGGVAHVLRFGAVGEEDGAQLGAGDGLEVGAGELRAGVVHGDEGGLARLGDALDALGDGAAQLFDRHGLVGEGEEDGVGAGLKRRVEGVAGAGAKDAAKPHLDAARHAAVEGGEMQVAAQSHHPLQVIEDVAIEDFGDPLAGHGPPVAVVAEMQPGWCHRAPGTHRTPRRAGG